jgi:tetratricopeptide (TPR) repeat protein
MANAVKVFVSAASADLGSFRNQVTHWILDKGWLPVVQDHFAPDDKTVAEMLQKRIGECDAVVHIVGACYGAEPQSPPKDKPRMSYTQMEAAIARKLRKRLFIVLLDEQFPYDAHQPEPDELRALQQAYRRQVATGDHLYIPCSTPNELEREIRELRIEIDKLRRSRFAIAVVSSILLVAALWFAFYSWHARQRDVRDILTQVIQQTQNMPSDHSPESQKQRLHAAIYKIASESGLDPDALGKRIDDFIAETAANRAASLRDQALAAFAKGDNAKTEQLAEEAASSIRTGPGSDEFKRPLIRDMHLLAAEAATHQDRWPQAETYSRQALTNAKPDAEADIYVVIELYLGKALEEQERYGEAADAWGRVKAVIDAGLGQIGEEGVDFLNGLAHVQLSSHRLADCEATLREAIRLAGNLRISHPNPQVVYAYTLLEGVLDRLGKEKEAREARKRADQIIVLARAQTAGKLDNTLAEDCELFQASATTDLKMEGLLQRMEEVQARTARTVSWTARLKTRIRLLEAYTSALKTITFTKDGFTWSLKASALLGAFLLIRIYWLLLTLREMKRKLSQEPLEPGVSTDPDVNVQRQEQYLFDLQEHIDVMNLYIDTRKKFAKGTLLRWAAVFIVALAVSALGRSDWSANGISGAPKIRSQLMTEVRGEADFAGKAFGPFSDEYLDSLASLGFFLSRIPNVSRPAEAEAEEVYKRVISSRQLDARFSHEKLAKLMEELAGVLRKEGRNKEADDWIRQAHDLRMAPVPKASRIAVTKRPGCRV